MNNLIELKPCPFCGGKAVLETDSDARGRCVARCKCSVCGACTTVEIDTQHNGMFVYRAVDNWNRRADDGQTG